MLLYSRWFCFGLLWFLWFGIVYCVNNLNFQVRFDGFCCFCLVFIYGVWVLWLIVNWIVWWFVLFCFWVAILAGSFVCLVVGLWFWIWCLRAFVGLLWYGGLYWRSSRFGGLVVYWFSLFVCIFWFGGFVSCGFVCLGLWLLVCDFKVWWLWCALLFYCLAGLWL